MKKIPTNRDHLLILLGFLLSRSILQLTGVRLDYGALYRNWQYLDVQTLKTSLLTGLWYDHTQPPFFNLLLGIVLKTFGNHARMVFVMALKAISLANTFLLFTILKNLLPPPTPGQPGWTARIPLIVSLLYLLSPATMLFENELFYTSLISLLFLISARYVLSLSRAPAIGWASAAGVLVPLLFICMTRSLYHLLWLLIITSALICCFRKKAGVSTLAAGSVLILLLTFGWYVRNYVLFGSFSSSTWMGMNLARNVFHDASIRDSSDIAAIEPFSTISTYSPFLSATDTALYDNLTLRDLHEELKNDSFINEKHVGYLAVSRLYMLSCKRRIKAHPAAFLKNIAQSSIIFFAPATRYSVTESEARKIMYYDLPYSFNLSHLAKGKQQRRIALTLSAIPKIFVWLLVIGWWCHRIVKRRNIDALTVFISLVLGYVFCVSSVFEHYENMRFRYEVEPLFLILAAQALAIWAWRRYDNKRCDRPSSTSL
jgi:hypothetical protein